MERQLQLPLGKLGTATRATARRRERATAGAGRALRDGDRRLESHKAPLVSRARNGGPEDWRIDQHTRAAGRRGLTAARAALAGPGAGKAGSDPAVDAA
ncbi:MAG: hypothetical protein ABSH04_02590 [Acidimicrobiales bacterium]